jgi:hypothetical protein
VTRMATCHPERKHEAKGKCHSCYCTQLIRDTPKLKAQHDLVTRAWAKRNGEKFVVYNARASRKHKYGLTDLVFNQMVHQQGNVCAICGIPPNGYGKTKNLHVDHDHSTGVVRGLLCVGCNVRLAVLEDIVWRVKAENYLQKQERSAA